MANKQATLIIKLKDMASSGIKGLGKIFDKFVFTAGDVVNGIRSMISAAKQMIEISAQAKSVKTAFANLAASQGQDAQTMLNNMRDLSKGTISDLELMKQANQALLLGLPVDKFGDMLTIARSSAQATGQSMDFMLNSIVTGLGRGSKLMLDNLGIMIDTNKAYENYASTLGKTADQLTDAEKKQAFINEALRIGKNNADAAGASSLTVSDRMAQLAAQAENAKVSLAEGLGPSFEILLRTAQKVGTAFTTFFSAGGVGVRWAGELSLAVENLVLGFEALGTSVGIGLAGAWEAAKAAFKGNFSQAKEIAATALADIKQAQTDADNEALANRQIFNDKLKQMQENHLQATASAKEKFEADQRLKEEEARLTAEATKNEKLIESQNTELQMVGATRSRILQLEISALQKRLAAETDVNKKIMLQKELMAKQEELILLSKEKAQMDHLNKVASLQDSHNKTLAGIGKAAALYQIAVDTPAAVMKAYKDFGYPWGIPVAAAVAAVGASQAAKVAGVQLADGGIVMPSAGGTQATIGEGGRAEAVIPLPDDFDPDRGGMGGSTNVNINFTGPMLGDENMAREFARAIDEELLKLRQRNESVAFDSGVF